MKIGIIGAMDEEVALLKNKITDKKEYQIANQDFTNGNIGSHEVILLKCGIGKVSAALGTSLLNQIFKPDYIINTGSAGALGSNFRIGDIVISSSLCFHDVDLTVFGYKLGQMAEMPLFFTPDQKLLNAAEECMRKISHESIKKSLIVSGDSFVSSREQIDHIKRNFSNDCIVEMESGAIAQVCHLFRVPFIVIRSVSDLVEDTDNKISYEEFLPLASQRSSEFVLQLLTELAS